MNESSYHRWIELSEESNEYRIIKLPKDLADLVDEMIGSMGYRNRTEFVKDAVRRLLSAYGIGQAAANTQQK